MDKQTNRMIPRTAQVPDLRGCKVTVGARQIRKALLSGNASQVYLAENADPALVSPLEELCRNNRVPYSWVRSMADLGRACGIDVGAAAAAVVN